MISNKIEGMTISEQLEVPKGNSDEHVAFTRCECELCLEYIKILKLKSTEKIIYDPAMHPYRAYYNDDTASWIEIGEHLDFRGTVPPEKYIGFYGDVWAKDEFNFWEWDDHQKKWVQISENGVDVRPCIDITINREDE